MNGMPSLTADVLQAGSRRRPSSRTGSRRPGNQEERLVEADVEAAEFRRCVLSAGFLVSQAAHEGSEQGMTVTRI